eukprot:TRINITY_DN4733_c0_g1_i1.p1 TRINITY_DN4733_c0_g1~~TRINITY_DN4733_c0_g1_i1.p1  ORF type:complete len:239 (-),score=89.58 TRINITY_DN4733_c0_g1_i1:484-1200(-)
MPKKKNKNKDGKKPFHRLHAHANPLADKFFEYPARPDAMDWKKLYPALPNPSVDFVDIGCGFGGLSIALCQEFSTSVVLAMEIRDKVVDFVQGRIAKLREEQPDKYQNVACIPCNCMKNLPNYFIKAQLSKMFILFPDPHFKHSKHRLRIITPTLLAEYAYFLRPGGLLYTCTDVEELHQWMVKCLEEHPLFRRVSEEKLAEDRAFQLVLSASEECKKVDRNGKPKYPAVFERITDPN